MVWPTLTLLHFSLSGFFVPLGTDEIAYRASTVALMPVDQLSARIGAATPVLFIGWIIGVLSSLASFPFAGSGHLLAWITRSSGLRKG